MSHWVPNNFAAWMIRQSAGEIAAGFEQINQEALDAGDVLIRVAYSSVNYKDALASSPQGRIVRRFPCVGGIDLAGTVVSSAVPRFVPGDEVIVTSYDLGVSRHGGYAEYALVPGGWVLPRPASLSLRECMGLGTAGLTAALALTRMEDNGLKPENGPVVVTGASGGVGCLAVDMLAARGYEVVAMSGKAEHTDWLKQLGAARVLSRADVRPPQAPLGKGLWAGAIDNVGGMVMPWLLASMKPAACVASIGLAGGSDLATTLMPFVLRGVSLLGIDSAYANFAARERAWQRLDGDLRPRQLPLVINEVPFDGLPQMFEHLLAQRAHGRTVVRIAEPPRV